MPILEISSRERSTLRAQAHPLRPIVLIGDRGLTAAVLKEIDHSLNAHGLIKIRAGGSERADREQMLQDLCTALSCAPVHHLGKTLIVYRPVAQTIETAAELGLADRKATEPHVPKKLAATGRTTPTRRPSRKPRVPTSPARAAVGLGPPVRKTRSPRPAAAQDGATAASRPSAARRSATARPTGSVSGATGIPRRSPSALSLRAGSRRTIGRPAGAAATAGRKPGRPAKLRNKE